MRFGKTRSFYWSISGSFTGNWFSLKAQKGTSCKRLDNSNVHCSSQTYQPKLHNSIKKKQFSPVGCNFCELNVDINQECLTFLSDVLQQELSTLPKDKKIPQICPRIAQVHLHAYVQNNIYHLHPQALVLTYLLPSQLITIINWYW